ncbi:ABC transporter permease [Rubrobacter taiwanensis]|jgi:cell division transport system permease protein|uniref:Cell division protein FtsX n=1 Tax=Rubrobacter taiwanensis TaxID=185139 RepID=A0A4R1BPB6_9ACTN|nr:permease-like cell division protein FtsX [Rubrobacter taiwanensis]TCJ19444.1 ABC transporter permease [Rubrobacter taiwanensis]
MRFNLGFFLREAFKNMRLNLLMSVTAATTTFMCILVLGIGMLVNAHVSDIIRSIGERVEITAFFPEDATQQEIRQAREEVQSWPEVRESTYVSKEEALQRFQESLPEIAQNLEDNPLPASIEISLHDPADSQAVADRLVESGYFAREDISYPAQTIDRLNTITGYITWALRGATALFLISSVLLISNAIRLSIFARRKEIEIQKLVGASDNFVRMPFVVEGMVQGLIGSAVAALVVVWLNFFFVDWANRNIPFFPISATAVDTVSTMAILIAVGVIIGVAGSYLSVRRFLKV